MSTKCQVDSRKNALFIIQTILTISFSIINHTSHDKILVKMIICERYLFSDAQYYDNLSLASIKHFVL